MQDKLTEYIYEVATPLVSSLGLQLWGIEIIKAGRLIVKIFVEVQPGGSAASTSKAELNSTLELNSASPEADASADMPKISELNVDSSAELNTDSNAELKVNSKSNSKSSSPATQKSGARVSIDQCAELSRLVGLTLDVEDHLENWVLEVSSPGLDRIFFHLDQLKGFIGQEISANLMASPPGYSDLSAALGRKKFQGILTEVKDKEFCIKLPKSLRHEGEPEDAILPWSLVRQVRLVAQFPEVVKPGKKPKQKSFDYLD